MLWEEHPVNYWRICEIPGGAEAAVADMQNPVLKVTAIGADDLAAVLTKSAGKSVTAAQIRYHIEAGAPVNADGSLNLVHYAAWLVMELARRGD